MERRKVRDRKALRFQTSPHSSRLDVFGSAARGEDFDPGRSDMDLLVQFEPQAQKASWGVYFDLRARLAEILGRPVDLVEEGSVRNPYLQAAIERDRRALYEP